MPPSPSLTSARKICSASSERAWQQWTNYAGGMGNPWAEIARRPHLQLVHADIPERGRYYHQLRTIVIRKGLPLVEARSTLWHELVHADRGDESCSQKGEDRVTRAAARLAIHLPDLADAILWSDHADERADQLKVTRELLDARLGSLHPAEQGYLRRHLSMKEHTA
jgi:hypothetical protein